LLQFFHKLPGNQTEGKQGETKEFRKGLGRFRKAVEARYSEATLERLAHSPEVEARQAAALALGLLGTMKVNGTLAASLHDEDATVCQLAADAMWSIWFRADAPENNEELQRLMLLKPDDAPPEELRAGFDALIRKAPRFAEAFNQRAIFHFRRGDYARAIADCEKALRLNPYHFGAASGMGQCFMKQRKLRAALRVYRRANRINPNLDGVKQVIESLERMLGEEGKR
jgi:tetratricopeptide (TPR) repeat protein